MKPSSRSALAATLSLAAFTFSIGASPAFAFGPSLAGHPAVGRGGWSPHGGPAMSPPGRGPRVGARMQGLPSRLSRAPTRIVRRFVPVYGGYAPYVPPPPEQPPATAPVIVETTTPIDVSVAPPADYITAEPICTGPQIVELGKPKKTRVRLPRVIYGTPFACIAAVSARHGPGVYTLH